MNEKLKKLIQYSSHAGAFLALPAGLHGQVIYHNIDPDSVFSNDGHVDIDFNADGMNDLTITEYYYYDLTFWTDYTMAWWGDFSVQISNFSGVISNVSYPSSYGAMNLIEGFSINSAANWNTLDLIKLIHFSSYDSFIYAFNYDNWKGLNKYIGVKFLIGSDTHYGWVRLGISSNGSVEGVKSYSLAVQDFAYEATADVPLLISNPTASVAEHVFISDVYENENASDFRVQFDNAAYESTVSAYRIFLCPYTYAHPTPPSLAFLETLPPERYMEVEAIGTPTYDVVLPATMTDINGAPVLGNYPHYYRALIVSMADGVMVSQNNVSLPSNTIYTKLTAVPSPYGLSIDKPGSNCDITDFQVSFHKAGDESYISEYRVYILNDDHDIIAENDPSYYVSVVPDGSLTYTVTPDVNTLIFEDTVPILFQNYYTEIMTIGDSIHASIASFRSTQYTSTYYGGTEGDEASFYCEIYNHTPVLSFVDFTKTPADIRVQFNGPAKMSEVGLYRIFIVPEADIPGFTPEVAEHVPWTSYVNIYNPDPEIDVILPGDLLDINGNPIALDARYAVMIGIYDYNIPPRIAISLPSEPFSLLSDEGNIPLPYSYIYDNELYVISDGPLPYEINLYNMVGEVVMSYEITDPLTIIDLSDLSKGIYVIKGTPSENMPATPVFVGHAGY